MTDTLFLDASTAAPPVPVWSIVLPVALGLTSVYLLLPRVKRYPRWWGAALGGLALVLAGWLLVQVGAFTPETVLFYCFSAIAVIGGVLLIVQANPVHAALAFALVVLSTCGLFLLLAAPFLMAATIIIYAGAIIVTFLFVIMLAQQGGLSDADMRSREPLLATVAGFVLLGGLLYVLHATYDTTELGRLLQRTDDAVAEIDRTLNQPQAAADPKLRERVERLAKDYQGEADRLRGFPDSKALKNEAIDLQAETDLGKAKESLLAIQTIATRLRLNPGSLQPAGDRRLSTFSGPPANREPRRDEDQRPELPAENVAYLGRSLFTDYLLPVELGGTLLLVATIGAIAITGRRAEKPV